MKSVNMDDYSLSRVPLSARLPMLDLLVVRIGIFSSIAQFLLGAALGYGMTFWQAFWAGIAGTVILEIACFALGYIGMKEGLSTSLLTRWTGFGLYGSALVALVLTLGATISFGFQNEIFAQGLNDALDGLLGYPLTAIFTGLGVTAIVIFGFKWLSWTAKIAVPLFLLTMGYGIYKVLSSHSIVDLIQSPAPGPHISFAAGTTMVAGSFMIGAILTPDMSRFAKNGKDVFWMTFIGMFIGEVILNMVAVLMAHAIFSSDIMTITLQLSGWLGGAIVLFATVKINDINLYASSLGMGNLINSVFKKRINRGLIALILGVLGTILSLMGLLSKIMFLFTIFGIIIPPIAGVMVVDYFILKRSRNVLDESRRLGTIPDKTEAINPMSLVAWVAGSLAGAYLTIGLPSLNAIIISGLTYYVGMKIFSSARYVTPTRSIEK
ncbi:cytosine permease [Bacillus sp. JJ1532]|uniref:purine-cytosine permease family protein n=1 Tax=Bacillus sp. JJ1532 TaxID=3122958 RepID=UPI002FFFFBCE